MLKFTFIFLLIMNSLSTNTKNLFDFEIKSLNSEKNIALESFKGKKVLIVNVASKCGYTSQYKELQSLYSENKDKLVIIGIPCNQFMGQEPGSEKEIETFCSKNYGVSFPMTEKVDVKGDNQHPIYQWLTKKELNGLANHKVSWNFNKFLIDENGKLIAYFPSSTSPKSTEITKLL